MFYYGNDRIFTHIFNTNNALKEKELDIGQVHRYGSVEQLHQIWGGEFDARVIDFYFDITKKEQHATVFKKCDDIFTQSSSNSISYHDVAWAFSMLANDKSNLLFEYMMLRKDYFIKTLMSNRLEIAVKSYCSNKPQNLKIQGNGASAASLVELFVEKISRKIKKEEWIKAYGNFGQVSALTSLFLHTDENVAIEAVLQFGLTRGKRVVNKLVLSPGGPRTQVLRLFELLPLREEFLDQGQRCFYDSSYFLSLIEKFE